MLAQHPDIFIPKGEIHYFDIDDMYEHPDFAFFGQDRWWYPRFEEQHEQYLSWYTSFFREASPEQLIGEDSTVYLASRRVPERIRARIPDVKIILMLRDPAARAYSHYWHLVSTGRAVYDFEDTLSIEPASLLERSRYQSQVERFLPVFPAEQIRFILFEDFVQRALPVAREMCQFVGVNPELIPPDVKTHVNQTRVPRNLGVQLWYNRLMRLQVRVRHRYQSHLLEAPQQQKYAGRKFMERVLSVLQHRINPLKPGKVPPMRPETRKYLNRYFRQENRRLSELIGQDVETVWYRD
jgi:hypothetical protein